MSHAIDISATLKLKSTTNTDVVMTSVGKSDSFSQVNDQDIITTIFL